MNVTLSQTQQLPRAEKTAKLSTELKNIFGMTCIEAHRMVPITSLKFNKDYQRAIEKPRVEAVFKSIVSTGGFLPSQVLTINQDNEVVDGQQRLTAAIKAGIKSVPVSKYSFESKQKEAAFFTFINRPDVKGHGLSPVDFWYGQLLAGDVVAVAIYMLNDNSNSALHGRIALKGCFTRKSKWTITCVLETISSVCGITNLFWQQNAHPKFIEAVKNIPSTKLMHSVNSCVTWYENIFGTKSENPLAHRKDSFRAIMFLYKRLNDMGVAHNLDVINKMKAFNIDGNYVGAPLIGKKMSLINHYNSKRKMNTISYEI